MRENDRRTDFFNDLMFGKKLINEEMNDGQKNEHRLEKNETENNNLQLPSYIQDLPIGKMIENIDYNELMKSIDTLIATKDELKPLFKKIKPYIEAFMEKNK